VTPALDPAWAYGAAPRHVWALARDQAAGGLEVSVVTTDALAPHERTPAGMFEIDGVTVVRVRHLSTAVLTWLGWSTAIGFTRALRRRLAAGVDIVHLHGTHSLEGLCVLRAVPRALPLVVSQYEGQDAVAGPSAWWKRVEARLLARADLVVAGDAPLDPCLYERVRR
jgi:hypothetical protein